VFLYRDGRKAKNLDRTIGQFNSKEVGGGGGGGGDLQAHPEEKELKKGGGEERWKTSDRS